MDTNNHKGHRKRMREDFEKAVSKRGRNIRFWSIFSTT